VVRLPCGSFALDFYDRQLKPKWVHIGYNINAAITALWGDASCVAHALHQMRYEVFKLVASELRHKRLDGTVRQNRLELGRVVS
jgi:hypothetical protein